MTIAPRAKTSDIMTSVLTRVLAEFEQSVREFCAASIDNR